MNIQPDRVSRVLFLTDDREDYLADGLLHGLRQIKNVEVIDFPRKDCMYKKHKCKEFKVRGEGFTLYGLLELENASIDRSHIQQKLEAKWFDLVVISNIWRQWGLMIQWESFLGSECRLAILDGDDDQRFYPSSTTKLKHFGSRMLRNIINNENTIYFKREWTSATKTWPYISELRRTSFSIPGEKIAQNLTKKTRLFPSHIVDRELAELVSAQTNYAFSSEKEYRENIAKSRFGITTKRGGWECLRHYEIAASGTIPCFRNLHLKPETCAPHGLIDGINCISYKTAEQLLDKVNSLPVRKEKLMREAALRWAKKSSTKALASELLQEMHIRS